jgi:hypothetical protein
MFSKSKPPEMVVLERSRYRFEWLWAFTVLLAGLCVGCRTRPANESASTAESDGHQKMVQLLQSIHEAAQTDHFYLGDAGLSKAQRELADLRRDAPLYQQFNLNEIVGKHMMRIGEDEQAIKHLSAAFDILQVQLRSPAEAAGIPPDLEDKTQLLLAVACLRLGETVNCVHCQTGESCILPIQAGGVHGDQTGSREAIKHLLKLLRRNPRQAAAKWLLNIAYMTIGGYPQDVPEEFLIPTDRFSSDEDFPRFTDISAQLKLNTMSHSGGAIADDFDGDGLLDIAVSSWDTAGQLRFFRNRGNGSFEERIGEANLRGIVGGLNMVQADYDNDGDVDIFVMRGAWLFDKGKYPNSLLQNNGHGRFTDVTFSAGLGVAHFPTPTAAWSDFDNDGDLDLFVGNENFPCQLFRNDGHGHFQDIAAQAGVVNGGFTKAAVWGDYDDDRDPDLYVSNYVGENRLYRNNGDATFTDVADKLQVAGPNQSFPAWFWDFNNDGALDLFVASYQIGIDYVAKDFFREAHGSEGDRLYQGDGQGGFRDVAGEQGLVRVTQPMGCNFGDLDNDGFLDFYLGTGYPDYEGLMPNLMLHNRGGEGFSDVTYSGGFGHLQKGHGVAFADFDHDGDQDVFIEMGGAFAGDAFRNALFENPGFGNHWIKIQLEGVQSNRSAIGAKIKIAIRDGEDGEQRSVYKWVNSGGSFGCNPLRQEIGLGNAAKIDALEVYWPTTGKTQAFRDVAVDQLIQITEGQTSYDQVLLRPISPAD